MRRTKLISVSFLLILLVAVTLAQDNPANEAVIYFFYGDGCPHCVHEEMFLESLQQKYPQIELRSFETWYNQENAHLLVKMAEAYGTKVSGVPMTFVGEQYFIGYGGDTTTGKKIENALKNCLASGSCPNPEEKISPTKEVCVHVFIQSTCAQCQGIMPYLNSVADNYDIEIRLYDVVNESNKKLYEKIKEIYGIEGIGYPTAFIGDQYLIGDKIIKSYLEAELDECLLKGCTCPLDKVEGGAPAIPGPGEVTPEDNKIVDLPLIGEIDTTTISLPLFTIIIGLLDGFNPCAMWVLCFLLTLLIYAKSRWKILLIGGIFVFTSGFIYFLFMAAWLNFFLFVGYISSMKAIIALIAIVAGLINIKDFFWFKKGISLSIPESAKPKLFQKMRSLVKSSELPAIILGTIVLAVSANFVELLCTLGLPAIYTRILTLNNLDILSYYLYLALYNLVYIIPLGVIVLIFAYTTGGKKFTEKQGKILKLIGGLLMLLLGIIMLLKPELLMFG